MTITSLALYYWNNPTEMTLPISVGFGIWAALCANTNSSNFSNWRFRFSVWGLVFVYGIMAALLTNGILSFAVLTVTVGLGMHIIIDSFNTSALIGDMCDNILKGKK